MPARAVQIRRPPAEASPEDIERMKEIDEYGEIKRRLQLREPDVARLGVLAAKIQARHHDDSGEVAVVERGLVYEVQLSPRRNERTIKNKRKAFDALKKALGLDGVLALLEISLTGIDKVIPRSEQKSFISEERSGYRVLTVVPLAPLAPSSAEAPKVA